MIDAGVIAHLTNVLSAQQVRDRPGIRGRSLLNQATSTVARELCRLGKRVLILEWGRKPVVTGSPRQAFRELGMPGRSLFLTGKGVAVEAKVRRVLVEDGAATGVEFTRKGKTERAFAPHVVIAAGGIGSPLILRASGLERAGYDFFYDPLICALGSVSDLKGEQELPMQAGDPDVDRARQAAGQTSRRPAAPGSGWWRAECGCRR